jgi:glycosyltransferase involved in cell wall biosynthesis
MRIALDGLPLSRPLTGIGHYTLELASHLAADQPEDELLVVTPRAFDASARITTDLKNLKLLRPTINPIIRQWWKSGLPRFLRKNHVDLFHGTNFKLPLKAECVTVLTIHDLSQLLHPDTHESKKVAATRLTLPATAAAATLIITPTELVRAEVHEHLGIPLEKIVVVPEAARDCFQPLEDQATKPPRQKLGIGEEFLLYVGTLEPRKNLLTLVKSFETMAQQNAKHLQLVLAGMRGWMVDDLYDYVKRSAFSKRIIVTGYLSDDELRALYSSCTVFVYPSRYEGFGLPPLEAMACGAPVVASHIGSISEVLGQAALLVDPVDVRALTDSIRSLYNNRAKRQELAKKGIERSAQFSWQKTARLTKRVYEQALR